MMVCSRKIVGGLLLLMVLGWAAGCGQTQPGVRTAPVPMPGLPPTPVALDENPPGPEAVQPVPAPSPPPVESRFIHKVQWPRETLFSIARWYTGSGNNWPHLAAANPTVRPQSIHIGDIVLIPEALLKTRLPMPSDFPKAAAGPKKPPSVQKGPSPASKTETFKLYGPIDKGPQTAEPNSALPVPLEKLD
jgi:hypothetical protein